MAVKFKKPVLEEFAQQPKAHIEVETKTGGSSLVQSYDEKLEYVMNNDVPHATVGFKAGVTRNMGDYNSLRLDVSVFLPTYPTEEGIDAAYAFAKGWVDQKVDELLNELGNPT